MAPKQQDRLVGKTVVAPRRLWPDYPLPKGAKGWEGTVGKRKDAKHHFVSFPGDTAKYFFPDTDIAKWLVDAVLEDEDEEAAATPAASHRSRGGASARAAAADTARKPAASGPAGGKRKEPAAAQASPSKRGTAAAEPHKSMSKDNLLKAIISDVKQFDKDELLDVYETVLNVKLARR